MTTRLIAYSSGQGKTSIQAAGVKFNNVSDIMWADRKITLDDTRILFEMQLLLNGEHVRTVYSYKRSPLAKLREVLINDLIARSEYMPAIDAVMLNTLLKDNTIRKVGEFKGQALYASTNYSMQVTDSTQYWRWFVVHYDTGIRVSSAYNYPMLLRLFLTYVLDGTDYANYTVLVPTQQSA